MADEAYVRRFITQCRDEAKQAKESRMAQNKENFDTYHMRHDFSHKRPGQSKEVLSLQSMAVETTASFFQQALVDIGDWWRAEAQNTKFQELLKISPNTIHALTANQLEKAKFLSHVGLGVKSGMLGSLIITKVDGCMVPKPRFVYNKRKKKLEKIEEKVWQLDLRLVRQEDFFPDPTGAGLYEVEEYYQDYHKVLEQAEGDYAIYDRAAVTGLASSSSSERELDLSRETDQDVTTHDFRKQIKITEFWGTMLDVDGKVLHENCVATMANDTVMIRNPEPNPLWHQSSPYVTGSLFEVAHAVWPKALMDAPTKHNIAATELYNLLVDGGMRAVNQVNMIRSDWLKNPNDISNGIAPGTTLDTNSQCPPGAKVMESVATGSLPPEGLQVYNIINQEFNRAALTSDLRQGVQPFRQQSATAVVEQSQTITSVFQGVAKLVESTWITKILQKSWQMTAQCLDLLDEEEIESLLGEADARKLLAMKPEEVFENTVNGIKFRVFGISETLSKQADVRKYMQLLQTIGASEVLIEEFTKRYDFGELLKELIRAMDINPYKIERPAAEQEMMAQQAQQAPEQEGAGEAQPGAAPDTMSQVPQAASLSDSLGGQPEFGATQFPASRATGSDAGVAQ